MENYHEHQDILSRVIQVKGRDIQNVGTGQ
jgi:hypothetical protein